MSPCWYQRVLLLQLHQELLSRVSSLGFHSPKGPSHQCSNVITTGISEWSYSINLLVLYLCHKCLRSSPLSPSTTGHWGHCSFYTGIRRDRALAEALLPLLLHSKLPVQKLTYCVVELLEPALLQFEESLDLLLWHTISMKTLSFFWVLLFPPCRQLLTLIISLFLGPFTLGGRILAKN